MALNFTPDEGYGFSFQFASSGYLYGVKSIQRTGPERVAHEITNFDSPNDGAGNFAAEYRMSRKISEGTFEAVLHYNPAAGLPTRMQFQAFTAIFAVPPGMTNGARLTGQAAITKVSNTIPLDEIMEARVEIQISGFVTITNPS